MVVNVMWGYWEQVGEHLEWRPNPLLSISAEQQHEENKLNGFFGKGKVSKLERAQAIAAEVRARKFPAPRRITQREE